MINKNVLKFILGLKIKKLRMTQNLSLKQLSESSGLSVSYLNEIEKGKKYPSIEKLAAMAKALDTSIESLVSIKTGRNLHPLLKFLESDLVKKLPLDLFGLSEHDMIDLMASSPEKFANFLVTVLEVSRSYDMKLEDLYQGALRSYIESHDNYFPEIESQSRELRNKLFPDGHMSAQKLQQILEQEYGYQVEVGKLNTNALTEDIASHTKSSANGPVLHLNQRLVGPQLKFILGKEIGRQVMGYAMPDTDSDHPSLGQYTQDYKAGYFSGAMLIDEFEISQKLEHFFSQDKFNSQLLFQLIQNFQASTETFFHRLTQVLPHHFKLREFFMLRSESKVDSDSYFITKELHLGGLHSPHGVRMNEHYCRRWITIDLVKRLRANPQLGQVADVQTSVMHDGSNYLCISVAAHSTSKKDTLSCHTIGIKVDQDTAGVVRFMNDPGILKTRVGQTCERCSILDCEQRAAAPKIHLRTQQLKQQTDALNSL